MKKYFLSDYYLFYQSALSLVVTAEVKSPKPTLILKLLIMTILQLQVQSERV